MRNPAFDDLRAKIPGVGEYAYFQTSGYSQKPEPVIEAVTHWLRFQAQGPALPHVGEEMTRRFERTREQVAAAVNADPDEIMLNENATVGINEVASGIDWRAGDNVVFSTHEHPGNRMPWYGAKQRYGIELRYVSPDANDERFVADLAARIDNRTRLVSVSHVSRQTGRRFPIAAIAEAAHEREIPLLVDGAQSWGAIPIDMAALGCDFYALSGHKYIMGPQGTGAFFVRRDRTDWLQPSWLGSRSQEAMDEEGGMTLKASARRFEYGTRNAADVAGLGAALAIWEDIGWPEVFRGIEAYTDRLKSALSELPGLVLQTPLPYAQSSGIVTFHLPGFDAAAIYDSLYRRERVVLSPTSAVEFGVPGIRVSAHVFNTDEEMDKLLSGLRRILAGGIG